MRNRIPYISYTMEYPEIFTKYKSDIQISIKKCFGIFGTLGIRISLSIIEYLALTELVFNMVYLLFVDSYMDS